MKALSILLLSCLFSLSSNAKVVEGVSMPDKIHLKGKALELNGVGLREATIFKVDVYVGALYLEKKTTNPDEIIPSKTFKQVKLQFLRSIDSEKIKDAWMESFEKNCTKNCENLIARAASLNELLGDVKKGDQMTYNFYDTYVDILSNGKKLGKIEGKDFMMVMLASWIGKFPPSERLKNGMLGIN
jgi:hypothetical protein